MLLINIFNKGCLSFDECVELIKKRTRNYAKRQVTFFKNQFPVEIYDSNDALLKAIER